MNRKIAHCSVSRALEIVADPWTFLVLREAWFGVKRFDVFRQKLGMPRGTLTTRLQHLVSQGMLKREEYQSKPTRHEYKLTSKAADLYPGMLTMMRWGDSWLNDKNEPPLLLKHTKCGVSCHAEVVCSSCNDEIRIADVTYCPGPGAGFSDREPLHSMRRSSKPENFLKQRECSVARVMTIIGDRWTYLIMREAFFGVHRFHNVYHNLGISTNILTDRLNRLLDTGLFERRIYCKIPERSEYRFKKKGRELYGIMISLMHWGDKWLATKDGPPLILHHAKCDNDFTADVVCAHCKEKIEMREMSYHFNPDMRLNLAENCNSQQQIAVTT